ncbi:hypothetical protein Tco_0999617 [Tanacetum coccineum]
MDKMELQSKGVNLLASCKRSLGDGMNISFWDETWCGDSPLNVLFPRVYALEGDKKCKVTHRINVSNWNMVLRRAPRGGVESSQLEDLKALIQNILISDNKDGWKWSLYSNGFSVASARKYIDEHILPCGLSCTRWNKGVPIKDDSRALEVTKTARYILEGIAATLMWSIWNFQNALIFSDCKPKKATLWDSIVSQSFLWISSRNPKLRISWIGWLGNPIDNVS